MNKSIDNFEKEYSNSLIKWDFWNSESLKKNTKPILLYITHLTSRNSPFINFELLEQAEVAEYINENFQPTIVNKYKFPDVENYFQTLLQGLFQVNTSPILLLTTPDLIPVLNALPTQDEQFTPEELLKKLKSIKELANESNRKDVNHLTKHPILNLDQKIDFTGEFPPANAIFENFKENVVDYLNSQGVKAFNYPYFEWLIEQILEGVLSKEHAEIVLSNLERVFASAFVDQIRGGVFEFALDKDWNSPYFEKTLHQQSALLRVLTKLSVIYPSPILFDTIIMTLEYLGQEMLHNDGYFMNSQNSSNDGIEGLYFCFTEVEFEDALKDYDESLIDDIERIKKWFQIEPEGNLHHRLNTIKLNLNEANTFLEPDNWETIREVKRALLASRRKRIPPITDNNGIASWNFDLLSSLCDVIQYSKIEIIKKQATSLLNQVLDPIHSAFFEKEKEGKLKLNHNSVGSNEITYFEDYVSFIDAHTRLYEITGRSKFKKNALMSIEFVLKEFFQDSFFLTRQISQDNGLYQNLHSPLFDQSFRSTTGRLISIFRKWTLLLPDLKENSELKELIEKVKQFSLFSPFNFGESLRALTYPNHAYKLINVPKAWIENETFLSLRVYLSYRFLINYTDERSWEIMSYDQKIESSGEDLESFEKYLTGSEEGRE